jgi:hypothetical protein
MDLFFLKIVEEVKNTNKIVKVSLTVALIFAIASIGFANAAPKPLQIVRMCYTTRALTEPWDPTSPDKRAQFSWTDLPGNQFPIAHLKLDGNPETWYYLDVTFIKPQIPIDPATAPLGELFGFFLDSNTITENSEFAAYWDAKDVNEEYALANPSSWQATMWEIINGDKCMFSLGVGTTGKVRLYDGLLGLLPHNPLLDPGPVRLNGDYPRGTYVFTAGKGLYASNIYLEGVTITLKIK